MDYQLLFSIRINHNYYRKGYGKDLVLFPDEQTETMIRNHRMILRKQENGVDLIVPTEGPAATDQLVLPFPSESKFRFFLKLARPTFLQFTKLDSARIAQVMKSREFYHFEFKDEQTIKAEGDEDDVVASILKPLRTDSLEVQGPNLSLEDDPNQELEAFFLHGIPLSGLGVDAFVLDGLQPDTIEIDGYEEALKKILVQTNAHAKGTPFTLSYRTIPTWASNTLGVVDIVDTSLIDDPATSRGKVYTIQFQSKEDAWHYYVVAPSDWGSSEIQLGSNQFPSIEPPSDDDVMASLMQRFPPSPSLKHFCFDLQKRPYTDSPLTGLKLLADGQVIVKNLPNPSPSDQGKTILNLYQS